MAIKQFKEGFVLSSTILLPKSGKIQGLGNMNDFKTVCDRTSISRGFLLLGYKVVRHSRASCFNLFLFSLLLKLS